VVAGPAVKTAVATTREDRSVLVEDLIIGSLLI
jgi:hypothetical protein